MNMTVEWLERQCTNVTKCKTVVRSINKFFFFKDLYKVGEDRNSETPMTY